MSKTVVSRVDRNLARRLREARREVGLSTRAVASQLPRRFAVSHATIASYENGTTVPPIDVLGALADFYKRTLNWFLDSRDIIGSFRYWNLRARTPLADRRQFAAQAGKWAEAYIGFCCRKDLDFSPLNVPAITFLPVMS
jgi:transcriptional regulator with XRE-family HTH domain